LKVKEAIYRVYGAELPQINTQAMLSQIQQWKDTAAVAKCYRKLFKRIKLDDPQHLCKELLKSCAKTKGIRRRFR